LGERQIVAADLKQFEDLAQQPDNQEDDRYY
jgi:hypothetical protein